MAFKLTTRVPVDYTDITIRDGHQDDWSQEEANFDFKRYELPTRFTYNDTVTVTQKTLGAHYLDMSLSHNGFKPGDSGNGGRVEINFESDYIDSDSNDGSIRIVSHGQYGFGICIEGQSEREQFIKVMQTALEELKKI